MYSSTFISWKSIVTTAMPSPSTSILKLSAHTQPQHQLTSPLSTQSNTQRQRWRSNQTIRRSKPFKDVRPKSNQSINHNAEGTLRNFPDQKYATRNLASEKKDSPVLADAELMARKPATPVHNNRVEGGGGYMLCVAGAKYTYTEQTQAHAMREVCPPRPISAFTSDVLFTTLPHSGPRCKYQQSQDRGGGMGTHSCAPWMERTWTGRWHECSAVPLSGCYARPGAAALALPSLTTSVPSSFGSAADDSNQAQ